MDKKEILQDLGRLLDEIDRLPMEDAERRRLHQVVGEIETHVEAPEPGAAGEQRGELAETLDELITRFETDHPAFTGVLRRVMNTLGSMGV